MSYDQELTDAVRELSTLRTALARAEEQIKAYQDENNKAWTTVADCAAQIAQKDKQLHKRDLALQYAGQFASDWQKRAEAAEAKIAELEARCRNMEELHSVICEAVGLMNSGQDRKAHDLLRVRLVEYADAEARAAQEKR